MDTDLRERIRQNVHSLVSGPVRLKKAVAVADEAAILPKKVVVEVSYPGQLIFEIAVEM
jgi:hypothetical protein